MVTTPAQAQLPDGALTERVIGGYFAVYNALKPGLLEAVYRRAMVAELRHLGFSVETEAPFEVWHRGELVGAYRADLVVERQLIVECKAADHLLKVHEAQVINYLHVSGLPLGLLFNFGPAAQIRRLTTQFTSKKIPEYPANPVDPCNVVSAGDARRRKGPAREVRKLDRGRTARQ